MQSANQEIVDAAIAYADAVKAHKIIQRRRIEVGDELRRIESAECDLEISMNGARRRLDKLTHRLAEDQVIEAGLQRDGAMPAGAA